MTYPEIHPDSLYKKRITKFYHREIKLQIIKIRLLRKENLSDSQEMKTLSFLLTTYNTIKKYFSYPVYYKFDHHHEKEEPRTDTETKESSKQVRRNGRFKSPRRS